MKAREFIREAIPQPIGQAAARGVAALTGVKSTPQDNSLPGTQPKNLTLNADPDQEQDADQTQPLQHSSTVGTVGTSGSTQQAPTMGQTPPAQTLQQQQQQAAQMQGQKRNDAVVMATRMGMNPQQSQQFAQKIMTTGSIGTQPNQQKVSPQDMQKAMPKPGSNLDVKTLGTAKVLPTPSDEKGVKLDTTQKLGYPIMIDPRDLQK